MRYDQALTRYQRQLRADGCSVHTMSAYRRDLRALPRWLGKDPVLVRITPDILARFLASDTALQTPNGGSRARITVNRTKSALRSFFAFCVASGWIKENPARLIRSSPTRPKDPTVLTEAEMRHLRAVVTESVSSTRERNRLILEILAGTGIRLGSLVGLNIGDVDLQSGTLQIKAKGGGHERVFLNPRLRRSWAGSSPKAAHRARVGLTRPYFAPDRGIGSGPAPSSSGSPSGSKMPGSTALSPSTPSATPSPPGSTRRPGTCTSFRGRWGIGRLRRLRFMPESMTTP